MTDERNPPLEPFPTQVVGASPFPPLEDGLTGDGLPGSNTQDPSGETAAQRENRLITLGRFAFPPAPPLDDEGLAARDRRWTTRTIVYLSVFMLLFNAASIQNWSRQQAPGWVASTVQQLSDVWSAQLAQLGADQPRQAIRNGYQGLRDARFPGQDPAPPA
ncbi:hypothetical protein GVN24_33625 [Rhizobium sp. CRIBSB]|nr:hypothetical protein [Rhizobium sp. CRIBSB]